MEMRKLETAVRFNSDRPSKTQVSIKISKDKTSKNEKLSMIGADILSENLIGISMLQKLGFKIRSGESKDIVHAEYNI